MTYYAQNKERMKANAKRWIAQNKERAKELGVRWREAHPEYGKEYRLAHPELKLRPRGVRKPLSPERLARVRAYNKAHPEERRRHHSNREARKRGSGGKLSRGIYKRLLALQRGLCVVCRTEPDKYHIDHIIPLAAGGKHSDENVQLLCPDCNIAKSAKHPIEFMQSRGYLL